MASTKMAFPEIPEDVIMVDAEPAANDNQIDLLFQGEEKDESVAEYDEVGSLFRGDVDEEEEEAEVEEEETILEPKVPFKYRANPFLTSKDKKFLDMENYFFSLLGSPELTIDDILKGTFDSHEIMLITPEPDSREITRLQRGHAREYYKNLETRFKGHPQTLAFKLACLYFGYPVEPIRTGTMSPPGPGFLEESEDEEQKATPTVNPLKFLEDHEKKMIGK